MSPSPDSGKAPPTQELESGVDLECLNWFKPLIGTRSATSKQLPTERTGHQLAQWKSSNKVIDSSRVGADNAASKHNSSWGSQDELYEPQESRSHQLRMQIDPRRHLLDVLDMQPHCENLLSGSKLRDEAPIVEATTQPKLRALPTLSKSSWSSVLTGFRRSKPRINEALIVEATTQPNLRALPTLSKPSWSSVLTAHRRSKPRIHLAAPPPSPPLRPTSQVRFLALLEEVTPMDKSPASVVHPDASSPPDRPRRSFSEPLPMPRRWAGRERNLPPARPASPPSPSERIRISWQPSARSFDEEFLPARSHSSLPSLRNSASLPSPPNSESFETSSALARDRLRGNAARLLPTRLARIMAEFSP